MDSLLGNTLDIEAAQRDAADPLTGFRERFYRPSGTIYLDGNSLGLLSRDAEAALLKVLDQWRTQAVEGWTEAEPAWFSLAETTAERVGRLIGAEPGAVAVTNSTTVNLHQLLATLYQPAGKRTKILVDALNFPSDIYAVESHLRIRGRTPDMEMVVVPSRDGRTLDEADIEAALTPDIAVAVLPSVLYASGQLLDLARITQAARANGVYILWDLSHSIGAVPHDLDTLGADGAFWCHYKYLNAGPGAIGGLYLNRRHWGKTVGLAGWWGSDKRRQFAMRHDFTPAGDAGSLQIGTPPILSLAPLSGALTVHEEAGMERLREKSLALTDFLGRAVQQELAGYGFGFATPTEDARRGGHLALIHPDASLLGQALRHAGVVPDYRPPDILRLAPVALYTSWADCLEAVRRLKAVMESGTYREEIQERSLVT